MGTPEQRIIVGLGNPGPRYARNRHNVGFMVLDALARRLKLDFQVEPGRWEVAGGPELFLIKPLGYMNRSGEALRAWSRATSVPLTGAPPPPRPAEGVEAEGTEQVQVPAPSGLRPLIVCDDLALPLGSLRLRARGSSGGQNGLASVIEELGGQEVPRLRLGIAPLAAAVPPAEWPDYVLADFDPTEA